MPDQVLNEVRPESCNHDGAVRVEDTIEGTRNHICLKCGATIR